ncbi:phage tail tube protein [Mongoliimonas terrestris]|uniref:phage tail tube protein n=1 Tax=Mongoliimonas terrestris TaxID=1709001 RepID=UPI000949973E|nr:phage tail tube protein [Mongoliimonas terrestris]
MANTTANSKFYIGPVNSTADDATTYAALTYTEVGEIMDLGELGDEVEIVEYETIGDARKKKLSGTFDGGTHEITVAKTADDEGQLAVTQAQTTRGNYAFKLTEPSGETTYFRGIVATVKNVYGEANSVVQRKITIAVNSRLVVVEPA